MNKRLTVGVDMQYTPEQYLKDRQSILAEMAEFAKRYPKYDINTHTGPARLEAINKEYRAQFGKD